MGFLNILCPQNRRNFVSNRSLVKSQTVAAPTPIFKLR